MAIVETLPPAVPAPFREPLDPAALRPAPSTQELVRTQVQALLHATPAFHQLSAADQQGMSQSMQKIAAYAAECVRDDWLQSERLNQRPLVHIREQVAGPVARAQEDFQPSASNQVARVTQDTLRAIAFPTFVADLIKGTFEAITNSSIQQMEAYLRLLENVSSTVDQFMNSNISDDQARDWLAQRYPDHIHVSNRRATLREQADDTRPAPDFQADLNLSENPSLDEDSIEGTLVPAARRRLAQSRLQLLSTLVLMGINRIVVSGGKIRASMLFHIDASDRLRQEHATDMDLRAAASGSYGFGPWSVSASVSFAYVSSNRSTSESDLNVSADLTGEVEIHFKSDYFPLQRFAPPGTISQIQGNTAVPSENVPWGTSTTIAPPPQRTQEPLTAAPARPIGAPLPAAPQPAAPVAQPARATQPPAAAQQPARQQTPTSQTQTPQQPNQQQQPTPPPPQQAPGPQQQTPPPQQPNQQQPTPPARQQPPGPQQQTPPPQQPNQQQPTPTAPQQQQQAQPTPLPPQQPQQQTSQPQPAGAGAH